MPRRAFAPSSRSGSRSTRTGRSRSRLGRGRSGPTPRTGAWPLRPPPTHGRCTMKKVLSALVLTAAVAAVGVWPARAQETPRAGGELAYSVLAEPPSFDAHQEATFAVPHTTAPFYSLLVKFDPFEYPKIVPDLAESWTISPDGKVYEFKLRSGVKFHDGSALTSRDVKASLDHVIFPPTGVTSPRRAVYRQVASVEAPNPGHGAGHAEAGLAGDADVSGVAVELHLQGRPPREGPALVQEERDGHRPLQAGRVRSGLPRPREEEPRLLREGLALPRRLPCAVHPGRRRAGGGSSRAGGSPRTSSARRPCWTRQA